MKHMLIRRNVWIVFFLAIWNLSFVCLLNWYGSRFSSIKSTRFCHNSKSGWRVESEILPVQDRFQTHSRTSYWAKSCRWDTGHTWPRIKANNKGALEKRTNILVLIFIWCELDNDIFRNVRINIKCQGITLIHWTNASVIKVIPKVKAVWQSHQYAMVSYIYPVLRECSQFTSCLLDHWPVCFRCILFGINSRMKLTPWLLLYRAT